MDFGRHITKRLQRPKEVHQGGLVAPSFWDFAEVRRLAFFERLRLCLEVDLGVDVCRVQRDVPVVMWRSKSSPSLPRQARGGPTPHFYRDHMTHQMCSSTFDAGNLHIRHCEGWAGNDPTYSASVLWRDPIPSRNRPFCGQTDRQLPAHSFLSITYVHQTTGVHNFW